MSGMYMKYIQSVGISKKKFVPLGMLFTSLVVNNNEVQAGILPSYTMYENTTMIGVRLFEHDRQFLPEEYPTPKLYYESLPEYTIASLIIDTKAIQPLPLSMSYITLNGQTTTSVTLDSGQAGLKAFRSTITGSITSSDTQGKLITVKETTIKGDGTVAIKLDSNSSGTNNSSVNHTVMLSASTTGTETTSTVEFTNPNDSGAKYTVTVTSGTGGSIELGNGDNVVWIGGAAKEGFMWPEYDTGYNAPSKIYGNIKLGNGNNELKIYGRSEVHGDITVGTGNNTITLENASIGLIVKDVYTGEIATTIPSLSVHGNISMGSGSNVLDAHRSEIAGNIHSGSGNDSIKLSSSAVFGNISISGNGSNTVYLEYTTVQGGLTVSGGSNSIEIRGGFIGKPKRYNDSSATDNYATIKIGDSGQNNNTLNLYYLTYGGTIEGEGTIGVYSGAVLSGDRTIKSGQNVFIYASGQLEGRISFESVSQELYLYGGEINGTVGNGSTNSGSSTNKLGKLLVRQQKENDVVSASMSVLRGDVYVNEIDIEEGAGILIEPIQPISGGNNSQTVRWEDPITRILDVNTIKLGGDIVLHSGVVGDSLSVKGTIDAKGGSFVLDMNFEEGKADTLNLKEATITNTVSGAANSIVYFLPEKPLYYATLGTVLEGVILGDESLNIALSHTDIGGYEYELIRNSSSNGAWDLRLVRISASNYAYAGILENMRNYTRHVWTSLNTTFVQHKVAKHGQALSIIPNASSNKRVFKDFGIEVWANVNYITNTIYDPSAPTIEEKTFVASAGLSTDEIHIDDDNDISLHAFASYGNTDSKLNQYDRNHTMQMNALSLGVLISWQYTGLGSKHTLFTTVGSWFDMVRNRVNLEGLDYNTRWDTYAIEGVASFGYQLQEGSVIFITSLDGVYSFTHGVSFITQSNNAIDIEDDNQIFLRANALVGYSFNFGVTPFFQVTMEFPLYASSDGIIRSNGHPFKYNTENFTTSFNVGLNYTMSFGEDNLKAYCIVGIHKGQPSSIVEVGFMVNGGISYTF